MSGSYELLKQSNNGDLEPQVIPTRLPRRRLGLVFLLLTGTFALSALYLRPSRLDLRASSDAHWDDIDGVEGLLGSEPLAQCASTFPPPATPPAPINIWASLTVSETSKIQQWLEAPERNLNLTLQNDAKTSDNFVNLIEIYYPPKSAALAYLASPTTVAAPDKFARVTIHHGSDAMIKDYLVGPLPISSNTSMRQLTEIYHRDDIPFNARTFSPSDELSMLFAREMPPLADAMQVRLSRDISFLALTNFSF